tara:strand:+ start:730 stop:2010 length:1281 start_codon:yes stop_codon:yes gene_type:complete
MLLKLIPNKIKVWLIKHLYTDIAAMGDGGDTALAHVNITEVALLKAHGGAGTINPRTGLVEFKGKGGGSPAPQTSTSYSSNLPEYAQPFYEELLKQSGKSVYETDASGNVTGVQAFEPYTGDRLAPFNAGQLAVQGEVAGMTAPGQFGAATTGLENIVTDSGTARSGIGSALGYDPGTVGTLGMTAPGEFDAAAATKYMSPYQTNVTDAAIREAKKQADIQKNSNAMSSIGRGTFGGGREALMTGEADAQTRALVADLRAQGQEKSFLNAQSQFERDRAAGMSAEDRTLQAEIDRRKMQQQGEQYGAGLQKDIGLAGLQTGLEGARAQGSLGATEQMANLERLKSQSASAAEQQAMQQEIDNLAYQQYREEEDYQRGLLEYQSNILRGTAGALGSTQVAYAPPPSMASQIGGLGLAGLGLYNMMGS